MHEFELSELGLLHYFLRLQIYQTEDGIFVSQEKNAFDCRSFSTPMNANEKLTMDDRTPKGK